MPWKPDITVAAIVHHDGRFLLVEERIANRRVFNQPAGHVENGETPLQAVVRETREETAWQFTPEWLLGLYRWRSPSSGRTTLRFAFIGQVSNHDPSAPLDQPILATHWLRPEEIQARAPLHRTPLVQRCIDDYLAGIRFPLSTLAGLAAQ